MAKAATAIKPVSKEKARYELKRSVDKMDADDNKALESRERWESWVFDAYTAGLTYDEIALVSNARSRSRIDQVLRAERTRRGLPVGEKYKHLVKPIGKNGKKS